MKKSVFWPGVCILVVAMALWAACGGTKVGKDDKDNSIDPNSVGTAKIVMALTSGVICGDEIVKAQVEISAADMTTITKELTVDKAAGKISGTVKDIPFGLDRKFTIKAYDKDDKVLYEGLATAEVKRKETVDVKIIAYSTEHCITVGDANINGELVDQNSLKKGLVAYYPFNGNANDESGNGNNGVEKGGLTYTIGKIGQAASFDGVDDYITLGDPASLKITGENNISISLWSNIKTVKEHHVLSRRQSACRSVGYLVGFRYSNANVHFNGNNQFADSGILLSINNWYFISISYNSNSKILTFYVNDQKITRQINKLGDPLNVEFMIGHSGGCTTRNLYHGLMDDLRIYNRVLTEAEIQVLYKMGSGS